MTVTDEQRVEVAEKLAIDAAAEVERLRAALHALGHPNWRVRPTAGDAVTMAHFARDAYEASVSRETEPPPKETNDPRQCRP